MMQTESQIRGGAFVKQRFDTYITKQLVGRSGGRISVKSKPDHGTTFTLEFKGAEKA